MPSGWDIYYIVFLSAIVALGIPLFLAGVSYLISPQVRGRKRHAHELFDRQFNPDLADATKKNQSILGNKVNPRIFLGANAALVLVSMMLILIPCAGGLQPGADPEMLLRGVVALISVSSFAGLALLYAARKGDLSWLKVYKKDENSAGESL